MFFRLGRDAVCISSAGNWCAADDRLDSSPMYSTMKPTPMKSSSAVAANQKRCPSSVVVSPHLLKCVSESPMMSHLYLSSTCVNSFSLPHLFKVGTFQVPMIAFSGDHLICVAFSFFLWTVASVGVVGSTDDGFQWAFSGNKGWWRRSPSLTTTFSCASLCCVSVGLLQGAAGLFRSQLLSAVVFCNTRRFALLA